MVLPPHYFSVCFIVELVRRLITKLYEIAAARRNAKLTSPVRIDQLYTSATVRSTLSMQNNVALAKSRSWSVTGSV